MPGWTDDRDAEMGARIAAADPPPEPAGGMAALRARVVDGAEPLLASRRAARRRTGIAGGVGLAFAAGLGALLLRAPGDGSSRGDLRLESAVTSGVSESEFRALAAGVEESRALLLREFEER